MFEQVLPGNTKSILAVLEKAGVIQDSYLAGGTALALQLGHRMSYDLDFFTKDEFHEEILLQMLGKTAGFLPVKIGRGSILGRFDDVRFSILHYEYPLLYPVKKFGRVNIADPLDIGAMKILAAASRGTKRDFIDIFFICRELAPLKTLLDLYDKKYRNLTSMLMHIIKSLMFFEDAEADDMPDMLMRADWEEIKRFFTSEAGKLADENLE